MINSNLKQDKFLKLSSIYTKKILENYSGVRGLTRVALELNSLGIKRTTEERENHYIFNIKDRYQRKINNLKDLKEYTRREYDQSIFLIDNIDEDTVFYDVGGFHGYHTILGTLGEKVYTFEPDPENLEVLKENIDLNSEQEIELIEKPLWSEETNLKMHSGLEGKSTIDAEGNIEQKTTTVDNMVELGASAPDVIKIDVEGAEYHVLEGAEDTIKKHQPTLVIEVHKGERIKQLGGSLKEIEEFLISKNYQITKEKRSGEIHLYAKSSEKQ